MKPDETMEDPDQLEGPPGEPRPRLGAFARRTQAARRPAPAAPADAPDAPEVEAGEENMGLEEEEEFVKSREVSSIKVSRLCAPQTRNPEPETHNPKPETRNPKP